MAEIVHRTVEAGPVLLLLRRQIQFLLDPFDIGVAVGDDLFGRQLRRAVLGKDRRLLGPLRALGRLGGFRSVPWFAIFRRLLVSVLAAGLDSRAPRHGADHPAYRAPQD